MWTDASVWRGRQQGQPKRESDPLLARRGIHGSMIKFAGYYRERRGSCFTERNPFGTVDPPCEDVQTLQSPCCGRKKSYT